MIRHLVEHTASIAPGLTPVELLWEIVCISNLIGAEPSQPQPREGRLAMT